MPTSYHDFRTGSARRLVGNTFTRLTFVGGGEVVRVVRVVRRTSGCDQAALGRTCHDDVRPAKVKRALRMSIRDALRPSTANSRGSCGRVFGCMRHLGVGTSPHQSVPHPGKALGCRDRCREVETTADVSIGCYLHGWMQCMLQTRGLGGISSLFSSALMH